MKQFIMVAGVDHRDFTLDFGKICINRILELYEQYQTVDDLVFHIFDFKAGSISIIKTSKTLGAITAPKIVQQLKPISINDYPVLFGKFRSSIKKRMIGTVSITDVYQKIIEIGSTAPGELIEVSFFTPNDTGSFVAVVNQFIDVKKLKPNDQKLEREGYRIKGEIDIASYSDFSSPRMSESELQTFLAAFAKDGYVWLWGGYLGSTKTHVKELEVSFELAELIVSDPLYVKGKLPDRTIFTFPKVSNELFEFLKYEVEYDHELILNRNDLRLPFGYLKELLYDELEHSSAIYQFFGDLGIKTYGLIHPVPMEREKDRAFNVFRAPDRFKKYIEFFRDEFGLQFDSDRYYSIMDLSFEDYDDASYESSDFFPAKSKNPPSTTPVNPKPPDPPRIPATLPTSFPATQSSTQPVKPPASQSGSAPSTTQPVSQPTVPAETGLQKEFVFVAGVDYKFNRKSKIDFREMAINRIKQTVSKKTPGERLHFTLFDFSSGKIISYLVNETGAVSTTIVKTFGSVSLLDYKTEPDENDEQVGFFQETQNRVMGFDHALKHIVEIGRLHPGTLMEFSVFSHGTEFRPRTLHFTPPFPFSEKPDPGTWRFYDPYKPFDFSSLLMNRNEQELFARAFHTNGYSWIWGYETSIDLQKMMRALVDSRDYKPGISFDTIIKLKPDLKFFRRVVDRLTGNDPGPRKLKSPFGFLIRAIATQLKSCYMYELARVSGKPVYGGLPGVAATAEQSGSKLMYIDQTAFRRYSQFFRDNFQFGFDPEKRGYGKYLPVNSWDATNYPGTEFDSFFTEEIIENTNS